MNSFTDGPATGIWLACCAGLFALQASQAGRFLRGHEGPPLTWPFLTPVALIFLFTVGWLLALPPAVPFNTAIRGVVLLVLAVPLTLTDLRCQWLPLRYTVLFWLGGLASAVLPGAVLTVSGALTASLVAFALTGTLRWLANLYQAEECVGLGDVYLLAGLYAWLPWRIACYAAAGGLVLACLSALVTRRPSTPFAPALFCYLCGVTLLFPQQLAGAL